MHQRKLSKIVEAPSTKIDDFEVSDEPEIQDDPYSQIKINPTMAIPRKSKIVQQSHTPTKFLASNAGDNQGKSQNQLTPLYIDSFPRLSNVFGSNQVPNSATNSIINTNDIHRMINDSEHNKQVIKDIQKSSARSPNKQPFDQSSIKPQDLNVIMASISLGDEDSPKPYEINNEETQIKFRGGMTSPMISGMWTDQQVSGMSTTAFAATTRIQGKSPNLNHTSIFTRNTPGTAVKVEQSTALTSQNELGYQSPLSAFKQKMINKHKRTRSMTNLKSIINSAQSSNNYGKIPDSNVSQFTQNTEMEHLLRYIKTQQNKSTLFTQESKTRHQRTKSYQQNQHPLKNKALIPPQHKNQQINSQNKIKQPSLLLSNFNQQPHNQTLTSFNNTQSSQTIFSISQLIKNINTPNTNGQSDQFYQQFNYLFTNQVFELLQQLIDTKSYIIDRIKELKFQKQSILDSIPKTEPIILTQEIELNNQKQQALKDNIKDLLETIQKIKEKCVEKENEYAINNQQLMENIQQAHGSLNNMHIQFIREKEEQQLINNGREQEIVLMQNRLDSQQEQIVQLSGMVKECQERQSEALSSLRNKSSHFSKAIQIDNINNMLNSSRASQGNSAKKSHSRRSSQVRKSIGGSSKKA